MHRPRRYLSALGALLLLLTILPFTAVPVFADSPAEVPDGFADQPMFTGLDHPMAVVFAPNGNVFVAEKRGTIQFYSSVSDTTPTLFADLNTNVHNYWDRGLMGLAVDPQYPAAGHSYVYVLYAYNHILGDSSPAPRWPSADQNGTGTVYDDRCTNPPQGTVDGCVISGRLSRLEASNGVMVGSEDVLIEDWCQQFPSHSLGSLVFGPEGALYASAGEGASFNVGAPDYGEFGGTLDGTPTPENPCGDPGGSDPQPPSAEGGALRAQDLRTSGDPVGLDGSVIRVDPATGDAWPTNANIGNSDDNAKRIIAYGLRNPFRITIKPGTNDVWIGDVGFSTWEELDTLSNPDAAPKDFGWPCYEGAAVHPLFADLGLSICNNLSASDVTAPYFAYRHGSGIADNDGGCGTGSSSVSGLAFLSSTSGYPNNFDGALFMADYSRKCIWVFPKGSNGQPDTSSPSLFANLGDRPAGQVDGGAVYLTTGPNGDLVYADYDRGEIRRIHYYGSNSPPVASFTATPSSGHAPLTVAFNAHGSSDADGDPLTYSWDLNGDGVYGDSTAVTTSKTYTTNGVVTVGLHVSDGTTVTGVTQRISVGNTPPTVTIDTPDPSLTWAVGDTISFSGHANDAEDGALPDSAFQWTLVIRHCPSDCHSHIVQHWTGQSDGSFIAPDHEYPSHLQIFVTVTDSGGLTASAERDIYPQTGTVSGNTSPAGIPITVGTNHGAPPAPVTAIINSKVTVSAPVSAVLGEGIWTFQDWNDGGARTHIVASPAAVTADYAKTGFVDRSNTCSGSPAAVAPNDKWVDGAFQTTNDSDWYRFKLTSTARVRLIMGNLPTNARMDLYSGCTKLLQSSDRGGNGYEEIIRNLPAGSYAVRLRGSGDSSSPDYVFKMTKLGTGLRVLSARARTDDGVLRLVGEVFNNSSKAVGPVKVTVKLFNASGGLLATRTGTADLSYVSPGGRAPFAIAGSIPDGLDHESWSTSAPNTSHSIGAPATTLTSNGPDGDDHWAIAGGARNPYSTTVTNLRVAATLYDAIGAVLDAAGAPVGTSTLHGGASTTYSATFPSTGLTPDRLIVRGMDFR